MATNKTNTKKITKVQKTKPKNNLKKPGQKIGGGNLKKRSLILFSVIVFAAMGTVVLLRARAATLNFEAESVSKTKEVLIANDSLASGGKYAEFVNANSTTTSTQRFPGDPNPRVTGKAYWGAAINGNGDPSRHETSSGKSLSIRRTYFDWNGRDKMVNMAKSDLAANRLPFVSTKTPGWEEMFSGRRDAEIDDVLKKLDNVGGPVWLAVHHEPEGGGGGGVGPKGEDDITGAAGWIKMQQKIRERMNVVGTKNIAFVSNLMTWTWDNRSGRDPNDWWVNNVWDVYTANTYCDGNGCENGGETPVSTTMWKNYEKFMNEKGIPYGVGEWGDRGEGSGAGADIKAVWDHGFNNNKDLVAWAYFDSNLNSPSGGWELRGEALNMFQNIQKNDQRVQRVKELNSGGLSTTNYGSITSKVTIPEGGSYKVWARLSSSTGTNAVNVQVDSGQVMSLGGPTTTSDWTWVDYRNGDVTNKTTQNLSPGERTVTITGVNKGVKLDRIMLTNENCIPEGTGDNCTMAVPPPPTRPNINIVSPTNGQSVSSVVPVRVDPGNQSVTEVSFRVNDKWQTTDREAPFEWSWDTSKFPNGSYEVVTRSRLAGDPGNVYTESKVSVRINNQQSVPNPPTPPADTEAPTTPSGMRAVLNFDWTRMRYVIDLSWLPSVDNDKVVDYVVRRDGVQLGASNNTRFTDRTSMSAGRTYTYSVSASDSVGNTSSDARLRLDTSCNFIFCSINIR